VTRRTATDRQPATVTGEPAPMKGTSMSELPHTGHRRRTRHAVTVFATALALLALTACGSSQQEAGEEKKLEQILTGVDEYDGYGPTLIKVRQGMGEAEIAIAQGVADGMELRDMDFDYFNATMVRSSAYPGTIGLHEVYGGLHPILSIDEGDTLVVAIADPEGLCYFLRATMNDGKVAFARGLASVFPCMAGTIPSYTTWTAVGAKDWPTLAELTFPDSQPPQPGAAQQGGTMQGGGQNAVPQPGTTTAPGK
jgi:hypothetical protein